MRNLHGNIRARHRGRSVVPACIPALAQSTRAIHPPAVPQALERLLDRGRERSGTDASSKANEEMRAGEALNENTRHRARTWTPVQRHLVSSGSSDSSTPR